EILSPAKISNFFQVAPEPGGKIRRTHSDKPRSRPKHGFDFRNSETAVVLLIKKTDLDSVALQIHPRVHIRWKIWYGHDDLIAGLPRNSAGHRAQSFGCVRVEADLRGVRVYKLCKKRAGLCHRFHPVRITDEAFIAKLEHQIVHSTNHPQRRGRDGCIIEKGVISRNGEFASVSAWVYHRVLRCWKTFVKSFAKQGHRK